jgi:hypothetical protein
MVRTALVCLVISVGWTTGCVVGDTSTPRDDDPPSGLGPDAGGDPVTAPDAGDEECAPPVANLPNGNHNAGLACLSCHNGAGPAPRWTVAGTLYADRNGGTPLAGATIRVRDNAGLELELVTAANGNFYTSQAVQFPVTVSASKCPDTRPMTGKPQVGDCNSCHTANSPQGRIHLP